MYEVKLHFVKCLCRDFLFVQNYQWEGKKKINACARNDCHFHYMVKQLCPYALSLQSATCQMREKHLQSICAFNQKTKQNKKHALISAFWVKSREKEAREVLTPWLSDLLLYQVQKEATAVLDGQSEMGSKQQKQTLLKQWGNLCSTYREHDVMKRFIVCMWKLSEHFSIGATLKNLFTDMPLYHTTLIKRWKSDILTFNKLNRGQQALAEEFNLN